MFGKFWLWMIDISFLCYLLLDCHAFNVILHKSNVVLTKNRYLCGSPICLLGYNNRLLCSYSLVSRFYFLPFWRCLLVLLFEILVSLCTNSLNRAWSVHSSIIPIRAESAYFAFTYVCGLHPIRTGSLPSFCFLCTGLTKQSFRCPSRNSRLANLVLRRVDIPLEDRKQLARLYRRHECSSITLKCEVSSNASIHIPISLTSPVPPFSSSCSFCTSLYTV